MPEPSRRAPSTRRRPARRRRAHYLIRLMSGMAASLLLLIVLLHLPIYDAPSRVGWGSVGGEFLRLQATPSVDEPAAAPSPQEGAPIATIGATERVTDEGEDEPGTHQAQNTQKPSDAISQQARDEPIPYARLKARDAMLATQNRLPHVRGGVGTLYLAIGYPEPARRAGIEGQLVLDFIVERDGSTSHVQVVESLHPLCDSAAAAALREVRFVPGRQNGEPVRVHMRLPVRFRLIGIPAETPGTRAADARSTGR